MSGNLTAKRNIEANQKQAEAVKLRTSGKSYRQIAATLGYKSASGAYEAVKSALAKTLQEPAQEYRQVTLERLDSMRDAVWDKAMNGDIPSLSMLLKIEERTAKLIGLDAPRKSNVGLEPTITFEQLLKDFSGNEGKDDEDDSMYQ